MPLELHAGAAAWDPHAAALGYGYNLARGGKSERTTASCYRYLWVEAEPDPAWASAMMQHFAIGEAHWKIPESQSGNTWIQAKIELVGLGAAIPPDGEIHRHLVAEGRVQVADTDLSYEMTDDGGIKVFGTLMDLDGPHSVSTTYPGPVVELTARQYIAPGVEFTTLTTQGSGNEMEQDAPFDIHTEDGREIYVAGGIQGTTKAESSELAAYVGSP